MLTYHDGYNLYSAYFAPNRTDPTGMWACVPSCDFQVQSAVNNGTFFHHQWEQALAECESYRRENCNNYGGFSCDSDCSSQCVSQGATTSSGLSRCLSACGEWKMANCPGHGQGPGTPNPWDWFFKPCLLMCGDKCRACVGVVSISLAGGITALYARNLGACALTGPAVGFCIGLATTRFVYQARKLGVATAKAHKQCKPCCETQD